MGKRMNLRLPIQRFISGVAWGLFLSMIAWSYSAYYHVCISAVEGVFSALLLAFSCGVVAVFGNLDNLMDNLPF